MIYLVTTPYESYTAEFHSMLAGYWFLYKKYQRDQIDFSIETYGTN
jgi:hypothetical protein